VSVSVFDAEDVFAYFRSARYFELRGEVIEGKKVFSEKACASCHQLDSRDGRTTGAPPVDEWDTLFDTAAWTSSLWNHAGTMFEEMERSAMGWPTLTEQEMVDLLLYLRTTVERTRPIYELTSSETSVGEGVFEDRGCADCHTLGASAEGKVDLAETARNARTMSGLAAAMWNHIPEMYGKKAESNGHLENLTPAQVASLASFFYSEGAFSEHGDIARGKTVFRKKDCIACHSNGVPRLTPDDTNRFNAPTMMSLVWTHGPSMLHEMGDRDLEWPEFSEREMEDLIAYLNDGHRIRMAETQGASEWRPAEESGR
jgi:cytochrome c2